MFTGMLHAAAPSIGQQIHMGWAGTEETLRSIVTIVGTLRIRSFAHFLRTQITLICAISAIDIAIAQLFYRNAFIRFGTVTIGGLAYHSLIEVRCRWLYLGTVKFIGFVVAVWYAIAIEEMWYTFKGIGTGKFKGCTKVGLTQIDDMMIRFGLITVHFIAEIQTIGNAITDVALVIAAQWKTITLIGTTIILTGNLIGIVTAKTGCIRNEDTRRIFLTTTYPH